MQNKSQDHQDERNRDQKGHLAHQVCKFILI